MNLDHTNNRVWLRFNESLVKAPGGGGSGKSGKSSKKKDSKREKLIEPGKVHYTFSIGGKAFHWC